MQEKNSVNSNKKVEKEAYDDIYVSRAQISIPGTQSPKEKSPGR
jgi:hypothetical protein